MSVYRKDSTGQIKKIAGYAVSRWNDRIFNTTRTLESNSDVYTLSGDTLNYIQSLTDYTEFAIYVTTANTTRNVHIRFQGKSLQLFKQDGTLPEAGTINGYQKVYTLDASVSGRIFKPDLTSYANLSNQPQINGATVAGNRNLKYYSGIDIVGTGTNEVSGNFNIRSNESEPVFTWYQNSPITDDKGNTTSAIGQRYTFGYGNLSNVVLWGGVDVPLWQRNQTTYLRMATEQYVDERATADFYQGTIIYALNSWTPTEITDMVAGDTAIALDTNDLYVYDGTIWTLRETVAPSHGFYYKIVDFADDANRAGVITWNANETPARWDIFTSYQGSPDGDTIVTNASTGTFSVAKLPHTLSLGYFDPITNTTTTTQTFDGSADITFSVTPSTDAGNILTFGSDNRPYVQLKGVLDDGAPDSANTQTFLKRRGTAAEWTTVNPVLLSGQAGYETDTGKEKVGDGLTVWNSLGYSYANEASEIEYANTKSGLVAATVQDALDEIVEEVKTNLIDSPDSSIVVTPNPAGGIELTTRSTVIPTTVSGMYVQNYIDAFNDATITSPDSSITIAGQLATNTLTIEANATSTTFVRDWSDNATPDQVNVVSEALDWLRANMQRTNYDNGTVTTTFNPQIGQVISTQGSESSTTGAGQLIKSDSLGWAGIKVYDSSEMPCELTEADGTVETVYLRVLISQQDTSEFGVRLLMMSNNKVYLSVDGSNNVLYSQEIDLLGDESASLMKLTEIDRYLENQSAIVEQVTRKGPWSWNAAMNGVAGAFVLRPESFLSLQTVDDIAGIFSADVNQSESALVAGHEWRIIYTDDNSHQVIASDVRRYYNIILDNTISGYSDILANITRCLLAGYQVELRLWRNDIQAYDTGESYLTNVEKPSTITFTRSVQTAGLKANIDFVENPDGSFSIYDKDGAISKTIRTGATLRDLELEAESRDEAIAAETLRAKTVEGDLTQLGTSNTQNLVSAINEINEKANTIRVLSGGVGYLALTQSDQDAITDQVDLDLMFRQDQQTGYYWSATLSAWTPLPEAWPKLDYIVRTASDRDTIVGMYENQTCGVLEDTTVWQYNGSAWNQVVVGDAAYPKRAVGDEYFVDEFYGLYKGVTYVGEPTAVLIYLANGYRYSVFVQADFDDLKDSDWS
jgi:hypothetical protein